MVNQLPPILDVGGVLISSDLLTEYFCCDYEKCKGICCVEGDAGAPVTLDEIAGIEDSLDAVWGDLSASAQAVIDKQGVAYTDKEGEGIWRWVTADTSSFEDWGINSDGVREPTDDHPYEDYAEFSIDVRDGYWNSSQFGWETTAYICEWNMTP